MSAFESKIIFELYNPAGTLLMDISGLAVNRTIARTRNDADEITFDLDLREFERLARSMNQDPAALLTVNNTEVRVRSRGVYIAGGQVNYLDVILEDAREILSVKAYGFLNIFSRRFSGYDEVYSGTEITSIVTTQLANTQAIANGNIGITVGHVDTVGAISWEFRQQDLKSGWQDLTSLQAGGFDMEITADKILNLYALQGAVRKDMILEYGANTKTARITMDGTQSINEIIALGSGIGAQATTTLQGQPGVTTLSDPTNPVGSFSADNVPAQINTTLYQDVKTYNGISDGGVLLKAATSDLSALAYPVIVAQIEVELNGPYLSDISIGDYIPLNMSARPYLRGMNGYYRLEKYQAQIDDEDNVFATLHMS